MLFIDDTADRCSEINGFSHSFNEFYIFFAGTGLDAGCDIDPVRVQFGNNIENIVRIQVAGEHNRRLNFIYQNGNSLEIQFRIFIVYKENIRTVGELSGSFPTAGFDYPAIRL